jgi:hypothetical protein
VHKTQAREHHASFNSFSSGLNARALPSTPDR